jgi:very-short-patch-repair endonuclease
MLLIELDGAGHLEKAAEDAVRDEFLRDLGWRVLRFKNEEVEFRLHAVLETIVHEIYKVYPLPDPLPRGEREALASLVWVATWAMRG